MWRQARDLSAIRARAARLPVRTCTRARRVPPPLLPPITARRPRALIGSSVLHSLDSWRPHYAVSRIVEELDLLAQPLGVEAARTRIRASGRSGKVPRIVFGCRWVAPSFVAARLKRRL